MIWKTRCKEEVATKLFIFLQMMSILFPNWQQTQCSIEGTVTKGVKKAASALVAHRMITDNRQENTSHFYERKQVFTEEIKIVSLLLVPTFLVKLLIICFRLFSYVDFIPFKYVPQNQSKTVNSNKIIFVQ